MDVTETLRVCFVIIVRSGPMWDLIADMFSETEFVLN